MRQRRRPGPALAVLLAIAASATVLASPERVGPIRAASPSDTGAFPQATAFPAGRDDVGPSKPEGPGPAAPRLPSVPDRGLLARTMREVGVETQPAVSFSEYLALLKDTFLHWLGISLTRSGLLDSVLYVTPRLLLVATAVLLVVLLVRALPRLLPARRSPPTRVETLPAPSFVDHRAEVDRLLSEGAVKEALAALWRHVAGGLDSRGLGRSGPDVTRREFIRSVRGMRPDWENLPELAAFASTADFLLYGSERVPADRVRGLVPAADRLLR